MGLLKKLGGALKIPRNLIIGGIIGFSSMIYTGCCDSPKDSLRDPPYGVCVHAPYEDNLLDKIAEMNPPIVRADFDWDQMEPERGEFNFTRTDKFVDFFYSRNIEILGLIAGCNPEWANGRNDDCHYMFLDVNDFKNYVRTTVSRYKNKVRYWEIGNEPNLPKFFKGTMEQYFEDVLVPAAEVIKNIDKDLQIAAPSVVVMENRKWDVWLETLARDYNPYFDIASFHVYRSSDEGVISKVLFNPPCGFGKGPDRSVEKVLSKGFNGKTIWMTETGFKTTGGELREIFQKDNYQGVLEDLGCWGPVSRVFFYHMIDATADGWYHYGILNPDLSEKEVYKYLKFKSN